MGKIFALSQSLHNLVISPKRVVFNLWTANNEALLKVLGVTRAKYTALLLVRFCQWKLAAKYIERAALVPALSALHYLGDAVRAGIGR
jgi:hypothetical protein